MNGVDFVLVINMVVAGLFAIAFLGIAAYEKTYISARLMALSFTFATIYFAIELFTPVLGNPKLVYIAGFTTFLMVPICLTIGLAHKYNVQTPWAALVVLFIFSVVLVFSIYDIATASLKGMFLYQFPYFLALCLSNYVIWKSRARGVIDIILFCVLSASAVHFMLKPLIAQAAGDIGYEAQNYVATRYALYAQSTGAALAVANGLLMLVVLMRDLMTDMIMRSETDALSRLLNRRGFDHKAQQAIDRARASGTPLSVIVCDLDHFKAVNDNFGHDVGDRVIVAFSGCLSQFAASSDVIGRLGGEEFAVLLPGKGLEEAAGLGDKVRLAFSKKSISGLPYGERVTASIGVSGLLPGDGLSDLMRRADEALYDAKQAGRNRVRVAEARETAGNVIALKPRKANGR